MQLLRSKAGQLFIVFFIHSFHNVKIQALPQSVLTASASSIGEEESVTLQCSAKAGNPPKKCLIYLISQTNGQKNIAFECQETFTGSVLLAYNLALAEVRVQCFYTVDVQSNAQPAPHSDIVSITVALPQSVLTANASSIREEESVTLQCSAKAGDPPKQCYIYWLNQSKDQNKIAFDCQVTFTGSDLLARTGALAEVKVGCFYTDDRWKHPTAPHSDIVSITVRRALPQSVLTASASSIREEESVTLQCSAKAGNPPEKCLIFLISPTNGQKNIAFECQETFTGSVLLAYNLALAEVRVQCFYTVDVQSNTQPAPHSDIVSITVRRVVNGRPTSASPTSARPMPARPTSASPTPASPTSARPTSASPTSASPMPASPTSASPMPASPTSASPHKTVVNPNSVVPGSSTSTSPTTAATTMVNSTPSAQYTPPGSLFLKAAIILIVCCGVIVFLIVLLLAVLKTWRRRKKNTMEMKSLNTGSSKVVNRSGSCSKKDGVYHVYSTISNEPSAPNQTLVYDLLQAN